MHIAILDEELPYPMTSGKRIRTLNLLRRLAGRHRITFICHRNADPDEAAAAAQHFRDIGIETIVVDRAVPPKSGLRFAARLAGNLLSPLPYSVATHASTQLAHAACDFASRNAIDLWHCEWTPYAQTIRAIPGARWLVMAHNVESLIWQRMTETEKNPARRWYIAKQWQKYERFERWAYSNAAASIAVTADDARLMRERFGARNIEVVDNGVDTKFFVPGTQNRDPKSLLFLGSLDWRPNLDAISVMLDTIFPSVRAFEPNARLVIVGRNPPRWLAERSKQPGVELHGNVPDVRPYVAAAGTLAVPLRIGGGSRLKILEALASGLPVVSTRVGAEGLRLEHGQHIEIANDSESMADAIIAAIRDPDRMRRQAAAGRARVLQQYDWDSLANRLDDVWLACGSRLQTHRAA